MSAGSSRRAVSACPGSVGYTLLELLVVLVLVVLVLAVVPPLISAGMPSAEVQGAARRLAAGLRYTRSRAIAAQAERSLVLDLEQRLFTVPGRSRPQRLPEKLDIKLLTTRADLLDDRIGRVRFFADGSSTGGRITIENGARKLRIDIEWLTGKVAILD